MSWIYVLLAGVVEIAWIFCLGSATNWWMWGLTILLIILSFYLIMKASEKLPVGTVYMVFTGMGTAGITLIDKLIYDVPLTITKVICLCLIVAGVIGIKISAGKLEAKESERGAQ